MSAQLEDAVDKWRESGAFGQDENQPDEEEQDDDRADPEFLPGAQEVEELADDRKFCAHLLNESILLLVICGNLARRPRRPVTLLARAET